MRGMIFQVTTLRYFTRHGGVGHHFAFYVLAMIIARKAAAVSVAMVWNLCDIQEV